MSYKFVEGPAVFDENNLVSSAGLVSVMALADQTRLREPLADKVSIADPKIASGAANPAPKLATLIAGVCAGADCIDDIDILRAGGIKHLFANLYAPRRWELCCASSSSATVANSNRCYVNTSSNSQPEPTSSG